MSSKSSLQCILSFLLTATSVARGAQAKPVDVTELKKALSFYQSIERLDVDFKQTKTLKDIQLGLKSEGHLTLNLPDHVTWMVVKPQKMTVDLVQDKITIQGPSETQTFSQSQNPSAKDRRGFATMLSWLKLDADAIAARFNVNQTDTHHYLFAAKDPEPMFKSLEMELSPAGHVNKLIFHEASGDEIKIQFSKPTVKYRKK